MNSKGPSSGRNSRPAAESQEPAARAGQVAHFGAVVLGAGAAGLFCAAQAGLQGVPVLLIDHARRLGEKIRISGGGRCNFTNRDLDPGAPQKYFLSANPQFCRSALARFTPQDFMALLERHGIGYHEKHKGQLFCDERAQAVVSLLLDLCERGGVRIWQPAEVLDVQRRMPGQQGQPQEPGPEHGAQPDEPGQDGFVIKTSLGTATAAQLVVATGGLSIPKIGASGLGHRIARQFGLPMVATRPGLVPLTFASSTWAPYAALAGVALPVQIQLAQTRAAPAFHEDLLFTHRGLSGPAILQISSYWQAGQALEINLLPGVDARELLLQSKADSRRLLGNVLARWLPERLVGQLISEQPRWSMAIDQVSDHALLELARRLQHWQITPDGTEGYARAEVTVGGVDTKALSSKTMESKQHRGLFFIGEVVDVTGWLGGYNFQWAWASASACAGALAAAAGSDAAGAGH